MDTSSDDQVAQKDSTFASPRISPYNLCFPLCPQSTSTLASFVTSSSNRIPALSSVPSFPLYPTRGAYIGPGQILGQDPGNLCNMRMLSSMFAV
jgi:hypothetical protein